MNRIERQELNYRLYFVTAYDKTGTWKSFDDLTRHYAFYATSDEEAWKICLEHIDSKSYEVNPESLYRFRDDRTLEKITGKPERSAFGRMRDEAEAHTDPEWKIRKIGGMGDLPDLLELPVTKSRIRQTARIGIE